MNQPQEQPQAQQQYRQGGGQTTQQSQQGLMMPDTTEVQAQIDQAGGDLRQLQQLKRQLQADLSAVNHAMHQRSQELQAGPQGSVIQQGGRKYFQPAERAQSMPHSGPPESLYNQQQGQQAQGQEQGQYRDPGAQEARQQPLSPEEVARQHAAQRATQANQPRQR